MFTGLTRHKIWSGILLSNASWWHLTQVAETPPFVPVTFSFSYGTSGLFHALHTLCTLCHTLPCILSDGLGYSVHSCQQTPSICHTQLPSYNVPPRGGWQLFWYFWLA